MAGEPRRSDGRGRGSRDGGGSPPGSRMTSGEITATTVASVLIFWMVGAYNRMVRLRSTLVASFGVVDEAWRQRHALLDRQIELLAAVLLSAGPRLDALRAACQQADAARGHARARPGSAGAVTSLRLAEEILADARARLPVQSVAGADLPQLNTRLADS